MPDLGGIVGVDKLDRGNEKLSSLWNGSGVYLDINDGPQTDTVGDRAAEERSGHDHQPGADVATEGLPSTRSSLICPMNDEDQRRESHLDLERTNNRDPQMSGTQTRARRGSTRATTMSIFSSCIFRHSYWWTNLAHNRADEPPPGHPDQTNISEVRPRITPRNVLASHSCRAYMHTSYGLTRSTQPHRARQRARSGRERTGPGT